MTDTQSHLPADHPAIPRAKTGILLANLGTPDGYDYWSMRRYLNEFLSDRRVIDYSPWKWQPLLQTVIPDQAAVHLRRGYKTIWNEDKGESPLMTITRDQTAKVEAAMKARHGEDVIVDFCMRYGNPSTPVQGPRNGRRRAADRIVCSSRFIRTTPVQRLRQQTTSFSARCVKEKWHARGSHGACPTIDRPSYIEALAQSVETRLWSIGISNPTYWCVPTTACPSAI